MSRPLRGACAGLLLAIMTPVIAAAQSATGGSTTGGTPPMTSATPPSAHPSGVPSPSSTQLPTGTMTGRPQSAGTSAIQTQSAGGATNQTTSSPVPDSFRNIRLGMTLDQVKNALLNDPYFDYRGPPDVSMLANPNENLIETSGYSFISRAFFQFYDKKLYIMILMLNPTEISYYTMYTTLTSKYGPSTSLSPEEVVWESPKVRLSLERPLSVKYIDKSVFNRLKEAGKMKQSERSISRDSFLNQF